MAGYAGLGNDFRVRFAVSNLKIGDAPPINKPFGSLADEFDTGRLPNGGRAAVLGGLMGCTFLIEGGPGQSMFPTGLCVINGTNTLNGSVGGGNIPVSGDVDVMIYAPNTATKTPVQTLHFEFPVKGANNVPIPFTTFWSGYDATGTFRKETGWSVNAGVVTFNYDTVNTNRGGGPHGRRWDGSRRHFLGGDSGATGRRDAVRSLVATGTLSGTSINGDLRLIAASQNVPKEAWQLAVKNVASGGSAVSGGTPALPTDDQVCNLRDSNYYDYGNAAPGTVFRLAPGLTYGKDRGPEVPPGIPAVTMSAADGGLPGDWDNGPGLSPDGPYINKPNEGESPMSTGAGGTPYIGPTESHQFLRGGRERIFLAERAGALAGDVWIALCWLGSSLAHPVVPAPEFAGLRRRLPASRRQGCHDPGPPPARSVLDAGRRAVRHQRTAGDLG